MNFAASSSVSSCQAQLHAREPVILDPVPRTHSGASELTDDSAMVPILILAPITSDSSHNTQNMTRRHVARNNNAPFPRAGPHRFGW